MKPARRFGAVAQLAVFLTAAVPVARAADVPAAAAATPASAATPLAAALLAATPPAATPLAATPLAAAPLAATPLAATPPAATRAAAVPPPATPLAAHPPPAALRPRVRQVPPNRIIAVLGQPVFGPDGTVIGRLTDVLVNAAGVPEAAVIDFGGFMGVGSRTIAVHWSTLRFHPAAPENRISITLLPAEIAAAPQYKGTHHPAPVVVEPSRPPAPVAGAKPAPAAPPAPVASAAAPTAPPPIAPPPSAPPPIAPATTTPAAIPPGAAPAPPPSLAAPSGQPAGAR